MQLPRWQQRRRPAWHRRRPSPALPRATLDLQPPWIADVGVAGDRIVFIGDAGKAGLEARKTVDARGKIVAPGYIDVYVHANDELGSPGATIRAFPRQLMQGFTTSVIGVAGEGTPI